MRTPVTAPLPSCKGTSAICLSVEKLSVSGVGSGFSFLGTKPNSSGVYPRCSVCLGTKPNSSGVYPRCTGALGTKPNSSGVYPRFSAMFILPVCLYNIYHLGVSITFVHQVFYVFAVKGYFVVAVVLVALMQH